jgi:hypothetical protein
MDRDDVRAYLSQRRPCVLAFSDVMGHSQAGVVERCGGYGVLDNEARVITTTRQRTLKAGTRIWSAVLLAVFPVSFVTIQVVAHLAPLQVYGRLLGCPTLTPHDLRHGVAMEVLEQHHEDIRALLGPARIDTMQIYPNIRPVERKRAAAFYETKAIERVGQIEFPDHVAVARRWSLS